LPVKRHTLFSSVFITALQSKSLKARVTAIRQLNLYLFLLLTRCLKPKARQPDFCLPGHIPQKTPPFFLTTFSSKSWHKILEAGIIVKEKVGFVRRSIALTAAERSPFRPPFQPHSASILW
jgi:hypothetical protein